MKVKTITYEMTKSFDFNNVKIGVVVDLEDTEDVNVAMERAREYVKRKVEADSLTEYEIDEAHRISKASMALRAETGDTLGRAERVLKIIEDDKLPF